MTKVIRCSCEHKQQDKMYGTGMRVHNMMKDGKEARCTVCSSTKIIGQTPDKT